jgi:hypothetical protein
MICETCDGCGYVLAPGVRLDDPSRRVWLKLPCDDCGGSGFAYCCEGEHCCEGERPDEAV